MAAQPSPQIAPAAPRCARDWRGLFDNVSEIDCEVPDIEGRLPAGLAGTLYRNGPGRRDFARTFFDGDGMIRALGISHDGRVRYRARFVETPKHLVERNSRRPRFRTAGSNLPGGLLRNALRPPGHEANTHVTALAGQLYALAEGGHPFAIDPENLATRGTCDFQGALPRFTPYSAHPHVDPNSLDAFNFSIEFATRRPRLATHRLDASGRLKMLARVPLPYATFIHDYALSPRWMAFYVPPLVASLPRFLFGLDSFFATLRWQPELGGRLVLVRRDGGEVVELEADAFIAGHFVGAFEDGDELVIDYTHLPSWEPVAETIAAYRSDDWGCLATGSLRRMRTDRARGRVLDEPLCALAADFPRIHPASETLRGRYTWVAANARPGEGGLYNCVAKVDRERGETDVFEFGRERVSLEPVFAPRPGGRDEDDGWLLCFVYDAARGRTEVEILDARRPADGPVCSLRLPVSAGVTFHGSWLPAPES